jgi:disulfide bond formation protein DsbB
MQVDPRGQRFAATITSVVLIVVLVTGSWPLLAAQALVFAIGAILGVRHSPYGLIFQALVRPRIGPPKELEDATPPQFAQGLGLAFAVVGIVGYGFAVTWLGLIATAMALVAAFLNAAFGLCLGCELYLLIKRFTPQTRAAGG